MGLWNRNYSVTTIPNTMRGRTGMTVLADITVGPPANYIDIDMPFKIEPFRVRDVDRIEFSPYYFPGYIEWQRYIEYPENPGWNYYDVNGAYFELYYKDPFDAEGDDYTQWRETQTNWSGYIVEGTTPNRTLVWRSEYQTFRREAPYDLMPDPKVLEITFYENNPEKFDFVFSSETEEDVQLFWWQRETNNSIFYDSPYIPDDARFTSYWELYLTSKSTDNTGYRFIIDDTWVEDSTGSGGSSGGGSGTPVAGSGSAFNYLRVWNAANTANAPTTGLVAFHENSNDHIVIVNIQNNANTKLAANNFKVNEQLYSNTGPVYMVQNMDQIIYLDTALGGAGYGFTANQTISQTLPDGTIVSGKVVYENVSPPSVKVTQSNAKFRKYPITNGSVTANVVGALSPPLTGNVVYFMPTYVINRPAAYSNITVTPCGNYIKGTDVSYRLGEMIVQYPYANTPNADYVIVTNYNSTNKNVILGDMEDRWTDEANTYMGFSMNVSSPNIANQGTFISTSYLWYSVHDNTNIEGYVDTGQQSYWNVTDRGFTTFGIFNGNENDYYTDTLNNSFIVSANCEQLWRLGANTSYLYTPSLIEKGYMESRTQASCNIANVYIQYYNVYRLTNSTVYGAYDTTVLDTLRIYKQDDPNSSENPESKRIDANSVFSFTLNVDSGYRLVRRMWEKANVVWPYGLPPSEVDLDGPRIFHFINIHNIADTATNNVWYGFNTAGEVPFPWYRYDKPRTVTVTYSWTPTQGTDLDTRTWLTTGETRPWSNKVVGWGYGDSQYIGPPGTETSSNSMTFTGDDTNNGTETVIIPIDTLGISDDYLYTTTKYQNGWANNYGAGNVVHTTIASSLIGRTGMTKLFEYGVDSFQANVTINTPFTIDCTRGNTADVIYLDIGSKSGSTEYFNRGGIIYFAEKVGDPPQTNNKSFIHLFDTTTIDEALLRPLWFGYKVENSAPNRVLTIREEMCDNYIVSGGSTVKNPSNTVQYIVEMKFHENMPKVVDLHYGLVKDLPWYPPSATVPWWIWTWRNFDWLLSNDDYGNAFAARRNIATGTSFRVDMSDDGEDPIPNWEYRMEKYVDIHCGAFWYGTVGTGTFSFKLRNDATGAEFTLTPTAQHRSVVGTGLNEFATYRLFLDYLRVEKIL